MKMNAIMTRIVKKTIPADTINIRAVNENWGSAQYVNLMWALSADAREMMYTLETFPRL